MRWAGLALVLAPGAAAQHYTASADIQYCTGGGKPLLMDVFLPGNRIARPTPAVLWLHGGGWERGDKNGSSGALFLADAGFVTASIYYRLSGEAKFPADLEDCKCAVRYLRANARKYGIDPNRIGVGGASSGGHLALLVGMADEAAFEGAGGWPAVSSRVAAVASFYGPTDFSSIRADFGGRAQAAIVKLVGQSPEENGEAYRRASPVTYVSSRVPPILLIHGDSDTLVPFEQSRRMLEAYQREGREAKLVKVENADHDFEAIDKSKPLSVSVEDIHGITVEFFRERLGTPAPPPKFAAWDMCSVARGKTYEQYLAAGRWIAEPYHQFSHEMDFDISQHPGAPLRALWRDAGMPGPVTIRRVSYFLGETPAAEVLLAERGSGTYSILMRWGEIPSRPSRFFTGPVGAKCW